MTRTEAVQNITDFIEFFKDLMEHDGYNKGIFDKEQAEKDIETFEFALKAIEMPDKVIEGIQNLHNLTNEDRADVLGVVARNVKKLEDS